MVERYHFSTVAKSEQNYAASRVYPTQKSNKSLYFDAFEGLEWGIFHSTYNRVSELI